LTSFSTAVKDINLQNKKKVAFTNPTFSVLKIRSPPDSMYCENFGRFLLKEIQENRK